MHLVERLPRETGRDYALRTLKENIVNLDLEPGCMVTENELAAEMGLSRTPVREALIELSKVKIVEVYPQKGSSIALIDYDMVEESLFMRNVLECAVVELDCEVATTEDVNRLREHLRLHAFHVQGGMDNTKLLELDNQFHFMLFEIAKKKQVFTLMRNIAIHFDRVRNMSLLPQEAERVVVEHTAIVDAIEQRNPSFAQEKMHAHLNRFRVLQESLHEQFPHYFNLK